jgi:hypothetical protein
MASSKAGARFSTLRLPLTSDKRQEQVKKLGVRLVKARPSVLGAAGVYAASRACSGR